MRLKVYIIALIATLAVGVAASLLLLSVPLRHVDTVEINNIVGVLTQDFDELSKGDYSLSLDTELDFSVINTSGELIMSTRFGLAQNINQALAQGDTIVDILREGQLVGKAVFPSATQVELQKQISFMRIMIIAILAIMALVCATLYFVIYRLVLRPFKDMKWFAKRVAAGQLDLPLEMRKKNAFGAFTECFDLMRDELKNVREREYVAEKSKRELVASLSHEIQGPVTSIKAVLELMEATTTDAAQMRKIQIIQKKAEQIHILSSELFAAALKKQETLSVEPVPFSSEGVVDIIEKCDYQCRIELSEVPHCLLQVDPDRLTQVIDNIISNSYKYAETKIDVLASLLDDGLSLAFRDYGPGVLPNELPLLASRYFRGKGTENKTGYGLGLFVARDLIERMGGEIECKNANPGFIVEIWLKFDGGSGYK